MYRNGSMHRMKSSSARSELMSGVDNDFLLYLRQATDDEDMVQIPDLDR